MPICGTGLPNTLGVGAASTNPLSATACSWIVADIHRMAAMGTSPVRSCRGYRSAPSDLGQAGLHSHPKGLHKGMAIPPLLCLGLMLQCQDTVPVCLLQGTGCGCTAHLGLFYGLDSTPWVLCSGNPWWPCLWVIILGPHSFSPASAVADLRNQLVHPWREPEAIWQRGCSPPAVSLAESAGAVEQWCGWSWGCHLEWPPAEISVWGLLSRQGWQSLSPLAWGDLLIRWLPAESLELQMVAVFLACCTRRHRLRWWGKPAAVTLWHLWVAGWLL